MPFDFSDFHFLRVELLWLFLPLTLILLGFKQVSKNQSSWKKVISPHLLKFLMVSGEQQKSYFGFWLTALIASLIIVAVSGPTFRQKAVPVFQTETARVVLLDLSLSMDATDIKPARIDRARHKIMDFLERTDEGTVGLVIYAGDAFIISPLTSDANTIASMVPMLATNIMPVLGSRPDIAINKAIELLENAKQSSGQIIWLTDGIDEQYIGSVVDSVNEKKYHLSILAIGTKQGAPIPLPNNNGFLKDASGTIILPKLDAENLKQVAHQSNGQYVELSANDDDIDFILQTLSNKTKEESKESDERISRWIDDGYWFTWFILVLFTIKLFRRFDSQLLSLLPIFYGAIGILSLSIITTPTAKAGTWDDLWLTKDQQAQNSFEKKDYKKASELFQNKQWQGAANYKQGNYESAINLFSSSEDTESKYNLANSLAKSQKFEEAIKLYSEVLAKEPEHEDAKFNRELVEKLQQQKEQQQKEQEQKDKENEDKENKDGDSDSDSKQESEKQDEQNSEDEKNSEQQSEQQSDQEKEQQAQEEQAKLTEDQRNKNEKDQALEHWLEKIPDDPGGLLRRKMRREYQKRGGQQKEQKVW